MNNGTPPRAVFAVVLGFAAAGCFAGCSTTYIHYANTGVTAQFDTADRIAAGARKLGYEATPGDRVVDVKTPGGRISFFAKEEDRRMWARCEEAMVEACDSVAKQIMDAAGFQTRAPYHGKTYSF